MKHHPKFYSLGCILLLMAITTVSCDIYHPKKSFRFAIPKNDFLYNNMYSHVKTLLEQNGYTITVVYTDLNIDANRLVAKGEADLAFVNNVSSHIVDSLDGTTIGLRTVLPLAKRALLGFTRDSTKTQNARQIFENKTIGIELLNGEGHRNMANFLSRAHIRNTRSSRATGPTLMCVSSGEVLMGIVHNRCLTPDGMRFLFQMIGSTFKR